MAGYLWIALGVMSIPSFALGQTAEPETPVVEVSSPAEPLAAPANAEAIPAAPEFVPMTASERARKYLLGAFGPGAILRAAAAGGIAQWTKTPKEWGEGPESFGDRFGNAFAKHVVREALEFGASAALKEDNRYFRSTDSGFIKRTKHVVASVFVARNEAGGEHFAYSRFGSVLGSSFLSRLWQPRSEDSSGDALASFGLTMVSDLGWNFFKEFGPRRFARRAGAH